MDSVIIRKTPSGIVVEEALRFELIATELFEAGSPWLSFHDVEASRDDISGRFVIHALNGDFEYRLTSWCSWLPQVACAELTSGDVIYRPRFTESACEVG